MWCNFLFTDQKHKHCPQDPCVHERCEAAYTCKVDRCCWDKEYNKECCLPDDDCYDPGCFPSMARVSLENGKSATMSELRVGDKVQTGKKKFIVCNMKYEFDCLVSKARVYLKNGQYFAMSELQVGDSNRPQTGKACSYNWRSQKEILWISSNFIHSTDYATPWHKEIPQSPRRPMNLYISFERQFYFICTKYIYWNINKKYGIFMT